jgi:hypothetical protein
VAGTFFASWRLALLAIRCAQRTIPAHRETAARKGGQATYGLGSRQWSLHVANAGGGLAQRVGFYVVIHDRVCEGFVGPTRFLGPGDDATIKTDVVSPLDSIDEHTPVVIIYLDIEETGHAWDLNGRHKTLRKRFWRPKPEQWELPESFDRLLSGCRAQGARTSHVLV